MTTDSIQQISATSVSQKVIGSQKSQYQLRIYSPCLQIQIVIFSIMRSETGFISVREVEDLVNLTVKQFGLNPNYLVWIEHDFSQFGNLSTANFSLITFDWYYGQASNARWATIEENWYLYWLDNLNLEYITI
jgi:hypothetical protein